MMKDYLPITKDIFEKILLVISISIKDLNINTTFIIAWADFLQIGEFSYMNAIAQV